MRPILDFIVGARPNFVKLASIFKAYRESPHQTFLLRLIHTGQHFSANMDQIFFQQLRVPEPEENFGISGGSSAHQISRIMARYDDYLSQHASNACMVVGDVNSTVGAALAAKYRQIPVLHVEAGLRSFDRTMPEELNRILTDAISDVLFTTIPSAAANLRNEGVPDRKIVEVGNTMIDTLIDSAPRMNALSYSTYKLDPKRYYVVTVHRPSNTTDRESYRNLIKTIAQSTDLPILLPVHPRIPESWRSDIKSLTNLVITEPMPYLQFGYFVKNAIGVITDSGGLSEETTYHNVPCITLRANTERPETVELGTNYLMNSESKPLAELMPIIERQEWKNTSPIPLWDGNAGKRIIEHLQKTFS